MSAPWDDTPIPFDHLGTSLGAPGGRVPSVPSDPRLIHPNDRPPVSRGWATSFGVMILGSNIAWAAPSQLLIANQLAAWAPGEKEQLLATIMAAGGAVGLIATPLAGIVSDATVSRFGKRAPWLVFGATAAAVALVGMGQVDTFAWLLGLWMLFQFVIAFTINAGYAIPPDRVATRQYGLVSGIMGLAYTLALVIGTMVATFLPLTVAYSLTAALLVGLVAQFVLIHREPPSTKLRGNPAANEVHLSDDGVHLSGLAAYRDFGWVFLTKLLLTLGNTIALFYLLYYLRDEIGMSDSAADEGVLILTVVYAVAVVLVAVTSGRLSDRLGRRKIFVIGSAFGVAAACCVMAVASSFAIVVVAAVILGMSWGVFTAIDQALINEVLPRAKDRGRDISFMNIATSVPNLLAPVLAAVALLQFGGYPGLYFSAAALCVVGGALVPLVRSAR